MGGAMSKETHVQSIMRWFDSNSRTLTAYEGFLHLKMVNLSARITELARLGAPIGKEWSGGPKNHAIYRWLGKGSAQRWLNIHGRRI